MAIADTWIVPGAPLEEGAGWRIWYSRAGIEPFRPQTVQVSRQGKRETAKVVDWRLFPTRTVMGRRNGVLTLALDRPQPGARYTVRIPEAPRPFLWRTLPSRDSGEVTFLLASCFWHNADREGRYGAAMEELSKLRTPAFKVLMGDQLYQDWPLRLDLRKSPFELYAERYADYWGALPYQQALQCSPNYFVCDDHEFWNNYPERQIQVPLSIAPATRREASEAAQELYLQYQRGANPGAARFFSFKTAGVSFFVADTRSQRTHRRARSPRFLTDDQRTEIAAWAHGLSGPGALVLPQPLFQREGDWKDYSLSNFADDHAWLCAIFEKVLAGDTSDDRPHDVLILTGDIHTGRHAVGYITGFRYPGHEPRASPASLVGPLEQRHKSSVPPGKLFPRGRPSWTVWETQAPGSPTVDNHVGAVRIVPGRNRRVRFELELWLVRPHDDRRWWERLAEEPRPQAAPVPLFRKEVELR